MSAQVPGAVGPNATGTRIGHLLLALFLLGLFGSSAELLLIGHTEYWWQLLPIVLMSASLVLLAWNHRSGVARNVRIFQGLMVLFVVSGMIGLWLHLQANLEFEGELHPTSSGLSLLWSAIQGQSPPTLAPGWMIELGLLGFVYSLVPQSGRLPRGQTHSNMRSH